MSYQKNNHRSFVLIQPPRCWMYKRWQGTKCFKTIRKRAKPDSNCSCACGALETPESQMQATNKHFHSELMVWGSSVFGIQFGSIYQKGIFQSAGPTPKISKPLSPIHWWWKKQAHPGDPQPLDAFASKHKSSIYPVFFGAYRSSKKQSPSRIRSKYLIAQAIIGWIIIKTLFCKSHDIPNPTIIWFSGTSLNPRNTGSCSWMSC